MSQKKVSEMKKDELLVYIATLESQLAAVEAGDFKPLLESKDAEIADLNTTITNLNGQIEEQATQLKEQETVIEELSKSNATADSVGLDHFKVGDKVYKLISPKFTFKGETITLKSLKGNTALQIDLVEKLLAVEVK